MKISFQALYDTTNEMAYEIQKEKGWNDSALAHLKKAVLNFESHPVIWKVSSN